MAELAPRWPCPVCLGVTMQKVNVGDELVLDHCPRCGGIWFEFSEVQDLEHRRPEALWSQVALRNDVARAQCHACHAHVARDTDRCEACGQKTVFDCVSCQQPMQQVRHGDVTIDVCKRCKGVWFDHHEVALIWDARWRQALERQRTRTGLSTADDGAVTLMHALAYSPDIVFLGAHAAGHVLAGSAETLARAPELLGAAGEVAADAAASVFETIVSIVAGIFS